MRFEEIKSSLIDPGAKRRQPRFSRAGKFYITSDWMIEKGLDFERAVS